MFHLPFEMDPSSVGLPGGVEGIPMEEHSTLSKVVMEALEKCNQVS